ncbi:UDP-N-acetylglucosamine 4,6-dehydratase (inverting) [bacterium]|nr:UDP-N-acetylglucosamine 4,6-dehydratase (inverting) [bacterium]
MLNDKSVLVTGATGSFGQKLIRTILERYPEVRKLIIFSRDELKQFEMQQDLSVARYPCLRYFLGDIRDEARLRRAFEGVDYVVHAAALKQVPAAEYNPMEFIKTNVLGAENLINAALACGVKRVVALSTDKAAAPINLYGATKLCSDKLFVSSNNSRGAHDIRYSVVRYGNVLGSRGSVIPFFLARRKSGRLPITDREMTRFNITLQEGVDLVLLALEKAEGGEIYVPRIPSYRILDVAEAVAPNCELDFVGIRPGEKIHEDLITESDAVTTLEYANHFILAPQSENFNIPAYAQGTGGRLVARGFKYNSGSNSQWLSVEELRQQIQLHLDPDFEPA